MFSLLFRDSLVRISHQKFIVNHFFKKFFKIFSNNLNNLFLDVTIYPSDKVFPIFSYIYILFYAYLKTQNQKALQQMLGYGPCVL